MLDSILHLFNSDDAAQVRQGLFLAQDLPDADLAEVLAGVTVIREPGAAIGSGDALLLRCCALGAHLDPRARYGHAAAAALLALQARRDPGQVNPLSTWQIRLVSRGSATAVQRGLAAEGGELLGCEESPLQPDQAAALAWLQARPGWRVGPARVGELARVLSDLLFADLASLYKTFHPEYGLLEDVLRALAAASPPRHLGLQSASWDAVPSWIPLGDVRSLDVSHTRFAALPPLPLRRALVAGAPLSRPPAGVPELGIDADQWAAWAGALGGVEDLRVEDCAAPLDAAALARLTGLRGLTLRWLAPPAGLPDLLRGLAALPALRRLSLFGPGGADASAALALPRLEELEIAGFPLALPPAPPPALRALRIPEEEIPALPRPWRAVAEPFAGREVWLLDHGPNKILVIKELRQMTGLPLKEAKDLSESAPARIFRTLTAHEAQAALRTLRLAGARVALR